MNKLTSMKVFCCTVNTLNFSLSAEKLHMSSAMVSKHIAYLEQRLGVRLFNRTTRQVKITEKGQQYYQRCHILLDELEQLEAGISSVETEVRGNLRISLPMDFGVERIAPLAPGFLQRYPKISLDLIYDDDFNDLIEGNFDLAIRISQQLADSSLIAKKLSSSALVMCASPVYLQQRGQLKKIEELSLHNCIQFSNAPEKSLWRLTGLQGERAIRVKGNLHVNNGKAMMAAALGGLGIALLPMFLAQQALAENRLVHILPQYRALDLGIYAIYPRKDFLPMKVKCFIDFIAQNINAELNPDSGRIEVMI